MDDERMSLQDYVCFFLSFLTLFFAIALFNKFYLCFSAFLFLVFISIKYDYQFLYYISFWDCFWLLIFALSTIQKSNQPFLQSIEGSYTKIRSLIHDTIKDHLPINSDSQACWQSYILIKQQRQEFNLAYPLIDGIVRELTRQEAKIKEIIQEKHCSYEDLGYYFIFLASKKVLMVEPVYHHRGQLTLTGKMIKRLFDLSLAILESNGFISKDTIKMEREFMMSEIAANG